MVLPMRRISSGKWERPILRRNYLSTPASAAPFTLPAEWQEPAGLSLNASMQREFGRLFVKHVGLAALAASQGVSISQRVVHPLPGVEPKRGSTRWKSQTPSPTEFLRVAGTRFLYDRIDDRATWPEEASESGIQIRSPAIADNSDAMAKYFGFFNDQTCYFQALRAVTPWRAAFFDWILQKILAACLRKAEPVLDTSS